MKLSTTTVALCALAALVNACGPDDQSLVVVSVDGPDNVGPLYYLRVIVNNGGQQDYHQFPLDVATGPITLPTSLGFHVPRNRDGSVTLSIDGLDSQMATVASGTGSVTLKIGQRVDLCIGLTPNCQTGPGSAALDGSVSPDGAIAPASDGKPASAGGLPKGLRFTRVAAGTDHSCAIAVDASLWCWGSNLKGQLGSGQSTDGQLPMQVPGLSWSNVAIGYAATCAIQSSGNLFCWGNNGSGQLGNGGYPKPDSWIAIPMQVAGTGWSSIALGYYHACAVKQDGGLWTWGDNSADQLGDESAPSTGRATPGQIDNSPWTTASAGNLHSCGLQANGTLWCWGDNATGELGDGTNHMRQSPTQVPGTDWAGVTTGYYHTCALKSADGSLWCWGDNTSGQLGIGAASTTTSPVQVSPGTVRWTAVSAGDNHTCALQADGSLWCWGQNADGQLGTGSNLASSAPAAVTALPATWLAVAAGGGHTCAVGGDGTLWCWGRNASGQLGIGSVASQSLPTRLGT